jgi:hypothetical protein
MSSSDVNPMYKVEQGIIAFAGVVFSTIGALGIYARRFPWNSDKAAKRLIAYTQWVILICGILLIIWSIDPRLLYGIYPLLFVLILKDCVSSLLISTCLLYSQVIHVVLMESKMQSAAPWIGNPWTSVGLSMIVLGILDIVSSTIAVQTNAEVYRAIWFASMGIILALSSIYSLAMFALVAKTQRTVQSMRSGSSMLPEQSSENNVKRSMIQSLALLGAIALFQIYMTIDAIIAMRTLTSGQIPDRTKYRFIFPPLLYIGGLTVCSIHCWLPLQNRDMKGSTAHSIDRKDLQATSERVPGLQRTLSRNSKNDLKSSVQSLEIRSLDSDPPK